MLTLLSVALAVAEPAPLVKTTHTFKTVDGVKIEADLYRPADDVKRPVVVWIHGGALITGNKAGVPKNLLDLCRDEGFALVSIDYRLAPEVKLPAIITDLDDAFMWIRKDGPKLLRIDPDRMVITGGSAGGYLTLMAGVRVKPRPRGLVAYWGYGDLDGDWYMKPSEHYRKTVALIEREEAFKGVGEKVITGSEAGVDFKPRSRFYLYCRQNGIWPKEVAGFDPADKVKLAPYCPDRNVDAEYPATLLIHGTEDTDVPYDCSANMAKAFAKMKVPHELVTVKGAGHGLSGGDKSANAAAHERALAFIRERLK